MVFRRAFLLVSALVAAACAGSKTEFLEIHLAEAAPKLSAADRGRMARAFVEAGGEFDVDPFLLSAIAHRESHFRPKVRGVRGGLGLMQIRAPTAEAVAGELGVEWRGPWQLHDPAFNIRIGAAYVARLRREFGSWELALAAFNQGPTRVRRAMREGRPVRSRYAAEILRHRLELGDRYRSGG